MGVPGAAVYVWAGAKMCFGFRCGDAPEPHHVQGAHEAPILAVIDQFVCVSRHVARLLPLRPAACFAVRNWLEPTDFGASLVKMLDSSHSGTTVSYCPCKIQTIQRPLAIVCKRRPCDPAWFVCPNSCVYNQRSTIHILEQIREFPAQQPTVHWSHGENGAAPSGRRGAPGRCARVDRRRRGHDALERRGV